MAVNQSKFKNEFRPGFTRNFSSDIIDRGVLFDKELMNQEQQDMFIRRVNEKLWYSIQEVNMRVTDRILPFVNSRKAHMSHNNLRIVVNGFGVNRLLENYDEVEGIDLKLLSHLLNAKYVPNHKQIMGSDQFIECNAKMFVGQEELENAIVDIFLDISMFNSFPFFKKFSTDKRRSFSTIKFNYYRENQLTSYYNIDTDNPPDYFSFAFYAREDSKTIDFDRYILVWKEFMDTLQIDPSENIIMAPGEYVGTYHIDKEQLNSRYLDNAHWASQEPKGAKLLLKMNRMPSQNEQKKMLKDYFGVSELTLRATKVVPLSEYFVPFVNKNLRELYISAFKVII